MPLVRVSNGGTSAICPPAGKYYTNIQGTFAEHNIPANGQIRLANPGVFVCNAEGYSNVATYYTSYVIGIGVDNNALTFGSASLTNVKLIVGYGSAATGIDLT